MKNLLVLLAISVSITASSQTYNVPVSKDSATIISILSKNGVVSPFSDIVALADDSLHRLTLQRIKKVIPPPTTDTILNVKTISTKSGTESMVHSLTDVPAGALILIMTTHAGSGKNASILSSPSLSWLSQHDASAASSGDAEAYTATTTTSGNLNITIAWPDEFQTSVVYVITGGKVGARAKATAQAAPSVSINTTKANSILFCVTSDGNGRDGAGRLYRDAALNRFYQRDPQKSGTAYYYTKQTTTVKSYTEGLSAPSTQAAGTIVIEVTGGTVPTVPDTQVPSASTLSTSSITANSVSLSWTAATDNIGVTDYDVFMNNALKVTTTQRTYTISGLNPSTTYTFLVRAKDAAGNSTASNAVTATTTAVQPPDTSSSKIEGFGASAMGGGNSSTVYHVTNLNGSGAGSLVNGLGSNRTIVFDVDGIIVARLNIANISYLTIDGNGRDITINNNDNGDGISFNGLNTHHCILKDIKVTNAGGDGINVIDGAHDIAITNCVSWGNRDGNIDVAGDNQNITKNVTIQWCVIGGGAPNASDYSGSTLITGQSVTLHHNLFSPATVGGVGERCPLVHSNYSPTGNPNADIRNNIVWRFGRDNGNGSGFGIDVAYGASGNAINNYTYTTGGSAENSVTTSAYSEPSGSLYAAGNVSGNSGINTNSKSNHAIYPAPAVTTQSACEAARLVLLKVGTKNKGGANSPESKLINAVTLPGCQ